MNDPERDSWPSVPDTCADCGCDLFPEERERQQCRRCYGDFLANCADDEQCERERNEELA